MTIKLDPSPSKTVVIVCDECPHWSAIRFGVEAAYECAVGHEKLHHPGSVHARDAFKKWRKRRRTTRR